MFRGYSSVSAFCLVCRLPFLSRRSSPPCRRSRTYVASDFVGEKKGAAAARPSSLKGRVPCDIVALFLSDSLARLSNIRRAIKARVFGPPGRWSTLVYVPRGNRSKIFIFDRVSESYLVDHFIPPLYYRASVLACKLTCSNTKWTSVAS